MRPGTLLRTCRADGAARFAIDGANLILWTARVVECPGASPHSARDFALAKDARTGSSRLLAGCH